MEKLSLKAGKRTLFGKKVKQLRRKGILPANIYGKKVKSTAVEINEKEFSLIYEKAGATGLVELVLGKEKLPVLIHNVQHDSLTNKPIHADFLRVDLKEKVTAKVPLLIVGEAPAVKDKIGVLLHVLSELEVEALPSDLPEKVEVDVSKLSSLDQAIKVREVKLSDKVKILTDKDLDVIKVAPLVSKEAEQMAKEEAEKASAAAAAQAPTSEEEAREEVKSEVADKSSSSSS